MRLEEQLAAVAAASALIAFTGAVAVAVKERVRHRWHLHRAELDLRHLCRLSARLTGCVVELEAMLDAGWPRTRRSEVSEAAAGHIVYLAGLRTEHDLFIDRETKLLAGGIGQGIFGSYRSEDARRCDTAHDAPSKASAALHEAAELYERGFIRALHRRQGTRTLNEPLKLVPRAELPRLLQLRATFDRQARVVAANLRPHGERSRSTAAPGRSSFSELATGTSDPYRGEVRPLARTGFGSIPVLHPAAR